MSTFIDSLPPTLPTSLRQGSRGERVRELQLLLLFSGIADPGKPDAIFGPLTKAAVQVAQGAAGLEPNGVADEDFIDALRAHPRGHVEVPRVRTAALLAELRAAVSA